MSKEARYKAALRDLEPNTRTAILYLEALIREKHWEALAATPRTKPLDTSRIIVRLDSLQKQIDGLKDRVKDLKDFRDTAAIREELVERAARHAEELFKTLNDLVKFLRDQGYFKEGELRKMRDLGFLIPGRNVK